MLENTHKSLIIFDKKSILPPVMNEDTLKTMRKYKREAINLEQKRLKRLEILNNIQNLVDEIDKSQHVINKVSGHDIAIPSSPCDSKLLIKSDAKSNISLNHSEDNNAKLTSLKLKDKSFDLNNIFSYSEKKHSELIKNNNTVDYKKENENCLMNEVSMALQDHTDTNIINLKNDDSCINLNLFAKSFNNNSNLTLTRPIINSAKCIPETIPFCFKQMINSTDTDESIDSGFITNRKFDLNNEKNLLHINEALKNIQSSLKTFSSTKKCTRNQSRNVVLSNILPTIGEPQIEKQEQKVSYQLQNSSIVNLLEMQIADQHSSMNKSSYNPLEAGGLKITQYSNNGDGIIIEDPRLITINASNSLLDLGSEKSFESQLKTSNDLLCQNSEKKTDINISNLMDDNSSVRENNSFLEINVADGDYKMSDSNFESCVSNLEHSSMSLNDSIVNIITQKFVEKFDPAKVKLPIDIEDRIIPEYLNLSEKEENNKNRPCSSVYKLVEHLDLANLTEKDLPNIFIPEVDIIADKSISAVNISVLSKISSIYENENSLQTHYEIELLSSENQNINDSHTDCEYEPNKIYTNINDELSKFIINETNAHTELNDCIINEPNDFIINDPNESKGHMNFNEYGENFNEYCENQVVNISKINSGDITKNIDAEGSKSKINSSNSFKFNAWNKKVNKNYSNHKKNQTFIKTYTESHLASISSGLHKDVTKNNLSSNSVIKNHSTRADADHETISSQTNNSIPFANKLLNINYKYNIGNRSKSFLISEDGQTKSMDDTINSDFLFRINIEAESASLRRLEKKLDLMRRRHRIQMEQLLIKQEQEQLLLQQEILLARQLLIKKTRDSASGSKTDEQKLMNANDEDISDAASVSVIEENLKNNFNQVQQNQDSLETSLSNQSVLHILVNRDLRDDLNENVVSNVKDGILNSTLNSIKYSEKSKAVLNETLNKSILTDVSGLFYRSNDHANDDLNRNHLDFHRNSSFNFDNAKLMMAVQVLYNKLGAFVKGYLTRRIMKSKRVQYIIQTIKDTATLAQSIQKDISSQPTEEEIQLLDRIDKQLTSALYDFHDIFFEMATVDKMNIITQQKILESEIMFKKEQKIVKPVKRLSAATVKLMERKQKIIPENKENICKSKVMRHSSISKRSLAIVKSKVKCRIVPNVDERNNITFIDDDNDGLSTSSSASLLNLKHLQQPNICTNHLQEKNGQAMNLYSVNQGRRDAGKSSQHQNIKKDIKKPTHKNSIPMNQIVRPLKAYLKDNFIVRPNFK